MPSDRLDHPLRRRKNLIICEPENAPAERFQFALPLTISLRHFFQTMDSTVDLDDKAKAVASEIGNVRPY